jgi:hypothetical protein
VRKESTIIAGFRAKNSNSSGTSRAAIPAKRRPIVTVRNKVVSLCVFAGLVSCLISCQRAGAAGCEAIAGRWEWFIGGEVQINPDGTAVLSSGANDGTWECVDAAQHSFVVHWRVGGFVNRLALTADGGGLTSIDPLQPYVSAKRIEALAANGAAPVPNGAVAPTGENITLSTVTDGAGQLPQELPRLMHAATQRARASWRPDAIPVALEFENLNPLNPRLPRGPQVKIYLLSPSSGTGLLATITAEGMRTSETRQQVTWGTVSLPPLFVDLPTAVSVAREHGAQGEVNRANLNVWNPSGAEPVLAWMLGGKTVNGTDGAIIDFDVTGYIARYNAQWQQAAEGLRSLWQQQQGRPDPWDTDFDEICVQTFSETGIPALSPMVCPIDP